MNEEETVKAFATLPDEKQARALALLAHRLTIEVIALERAVGGNTDLGPARRESDTVVGRGTIQIEGAQDLP